MRSIKPASAAVTLFVTLVFSALSGFAQNTEITRTSYGKPDLSGTYDAATLTPLQRPEEFGDNLELTPEKANEIVEERKKIVEDRNRNRGPAEAAPPKGGAPPIGYDDAERETSGAGNVGGYNTFWVDPGNSVFTVDGKFRTSIIVDPKNGRMPLPTEEAVEKFAERAKLRRPNDGTAWWSELDGPGPYDGPESLAVSERCLLGFTGAVPTFPSLYNNYKRLIQTEDHVMILIEMVHDARVVRMNSEHLPPEYRSWLGDSIGWWEGDTLVVDTTNFHPSSLVRGGTEDLHVVERFSRMADGNLLYQFTMDDDRTWVSPWSGEYVWRTSDEKVYEYACHEGNYAMEGILKGARLLEAEWKK
jgi:hypothetical protein